MQSYEKMEKELDNINWPEILRDVSSQDRMQIFHHTLYNIFDNCFPLKSKTVFNENQPFFTDKLARLKRKRCREYNKNRKSAKYDSLSNIYVKELNNAKKRFRHQDFMPLLCGKRKKSQLSKQQRRREKELFTEFKLYEF